MNTYDLGVLVPEMHHHIRSKSYQGAEGTALLRCSASQGTVGPKAP